MQFRFTRYIPRIPSVFRDRAKSLALEYFSLKQKATVQPVTGCARGLMISELCLFIFRHTRLSVAREAQIMLATGKIV